MMKSSLPQHIFTEYFRTQRTENRVEIRYMKNLKLKDEIMQIETDKGVKKKHGLRLPRRMSTNNYVS